tara:strand:+ start:11810 stop:12796 length:987 start_codon:yes stop_codon:yes gene_type:complete
MKDIFKPRHNVEPSEYPELDQFGDAIDKSHWTIHEFLDEMNRDIRDWHFKLVSKERTAAKRSILAVNTVENKVKSFWSHLDLRIKKPEVAFVGGTFAGNESVHAKCYRELLKRLNLQSEFETVLSVPCMKGRTDYLTKYLSGVGQGASNKEFTKSLILFTVLTENASLFSQFMILSSFRKYRNLLKTFAKIVEATSRDEQVHASFGAALIDIIRRENPEWFDNEMEHKIRRAINKAYISEVEVLDWIFEEGELDFMPKAACVEYLKTRFNNSLELLSYEPEFAIDQEVLMPCKFFERLSKSTIDIDFFDGRSTAYTKGQDFNTENIWD